MTRLVVNGSARELADPAVPAVLRLLGVDPGKPGVAVAVNGTVVPRGRWRDAALRDGDEVEVLTAVQGG